jgi:organic hydroperoxide reductase OsmC/OhrA
MKRKTFTYMADVDWEKEHQGFLGGNFDTVRIACPPEFGGPGGKISPEELFVASNTVCIMTTFIDFSERVGIGLVAYKSKATGYMEFIDNYYRFSKIEIKIEITISEKKQTNITKRMIDKAHDVCPVGKSSTCEVIIEPEIRIA